MKFENKLIEDRWKGIKQPKVLIATIQSDANAWCQNRWFGKIMFLKDYYDILIFENSDTDGNYETLKLLAHNYPNIIVKRGKTGIKDTLKKIVANRNLTLSYVRKYTGYDYVMFLDSDVFPPIQIIKTFLKRKLDVQCGLCFVSYDGYNVRPALNFFPEDLEGGNDSKAVAWIRDRKPRLIKIRENGMGCVFIKTNVLHKHKSLKFKSNKVKRGENTFYNEDLTFTGELRDKGYDLWLDLKMECKHEMKGQLK